MKKLAFILTVLLVGLNNIDLKAQVLDPNESPLDGVYSKSLNNPNRKPVPYVQLREADLMWLKRIWREVDLREKINQVFYYPIEPDQGRKNLMTIILESVTESGNITAYKAYEGINPTDMFNIPMTPEEVKGQLSDTTSTTYEHPVTFEVRDTTLVEMLTADQITKFRLKEEVFFDKQRSVMETRILGIAPLKPQKAPDGTITGFMPAFWIYFPEARRVFAQAEVYNRHNDVHRLTYDDVFLKRMFASRIIKESNVYNRSIDEYKAPMDALLEAEQILDDIRNREHDLWSF